MIPHVNRFGSSVYPGNTFSFGYSTLPPSTFQKTSGSLPSLTDIGCHVGCKFHKEAKLENKKYDLSSMKGNPTE